MIDQMLFHNPFVEPHMIDKLFFNFLNSFISLNVSILPSNGPNI